MGHCPKDFWGTPPLSFPPWICRYWWRYTNQNKSILPSCWTAQYLAAAIMVGHVPSARVRSRLAGPDPSLRPDPYNFALQIRMFREFFLAIVLDLCHHKNVSLKPKYLKTWKELTAEVLPSMPYEETRISLIVGPIRLPLKSTLPFKSIGLPVWTEILSYPHPLRHFPSEKLQICMMYARSKGYFTFY